MGVSQNRGTPKWMVYNGKSIKMDDLGVPLFLETPIYIYIIMLGYIEYGIETGSYQKASSGIEKNIYIEYPDPGHRI